MRSGWAMFLLACIIPVTGPTSVWAQSAEVETVEEATQVLREIMAIPAKGIPAALLANAYGVAIVPGMLKGGFVVGIRHGKGVLVVREKTGAWRSPMFIKITGGSIGFQAGVQATDVILVFKSQASVQGIMRGRFTIGADASVAAGPVGRNAAAATDARLKAEILSYSRSRGLFAGVAIDGAALQIDERANAAYYALPPGQPAGAIPPSALQLIGLVASFAGTQAPAAAPPPAAVAPPVAAPDNAPETTRQQLVKASQQLQILLDPQWQQFLALPEAVYKSDAPLTPDSLAPFLNRYQIVAGDPKYKNLTSRREFQETLALLQSLAQPPMVQPAPALPLPTPPR